MGYGHNARMLLVSVGRLTGDGPVGVGGRGNRRGGRFGARAYSRRGLIQPASDSGRARVMFFAGMVGTRGFEPPTSCAQGRSAARLRYVPKLVEQEGLEPSDGFLFPSRRGRVQPRRLQPDSATVPYFLGQAPRHTRGQSRGGPESPREKFCYFMPLASRFQRLRWLLTAWGAKLSKSY